MQSDIKILEAETTFTPLKFRTALKFGAVVIEDIAYSQVKVEVENHRGEVAKGFGGILLSDGWAWPSKLIGHQQRERTMKELTEELCRLFASHKDFGHPIQIFFNLEREFKRLNKEVCNKLNLKEEMPFLAVLLCASSIDAALHDAFGNVNEVSSYDSYGAEFMSDLSPWLGEEFKGKYIADYLKKEYLPRIPVFHLVGGLDKLRKSEVDKNDPQDGLPNSLEEWIERDGLTCLKIKLKGNDLNWDTHRVLEIVKVSHEMKISKNRGELYFSADTNEQCESPEYLIEMLNKIKEKSLRAFEELLYFEQPTERDLDSHSLDMHKLSKIKPVLLDEALLVGIQNFRRARELGWSGIALKTCKGQSADLIFIAKASEEKIPYSVQDLTNPKLSLIQSVGLAARINTIKGVEANARQFIPFASQPEEKVHPELFHLKDGEASTKSLKGSGLGYQMEKIMAA